MKIKNIEKLVHKTKTIEVIEAGGCIWIGNGYVTAPLPILRDLTEEQAQEIFSIPEKKRKEFTFERRRARTDETALMKDEWPEEEAVSGGFAVIHYGGCRAVPLFTSRGPVFAEQGDLRPFLKEDDQTVFYVRWHKGKPMIAAKSGMFIKGLIQPVEYLIMDAAFYAMLERLQQEMEAVRKNGYFGKDD